MKQPWHGWIDAGQWTHGTTKNMAEIFIERRKYPKPVTDKIQTNSTGISITYRVRKTIPSPLAAIDIRFP